MDFLSVDIDVDDKLAGAPPWVGVIAILSVALFFLVPLAAIALVVGYKMRRTRMLNETLVKLAEKGTTPPPEALQALGGASMVAVVPPANPEGAPAYKQQKIVWKSTAWSDLHKGVLASAVGLGFVVFSMLDDQTANWFGLVLLFVGVGYIVLWHFESSGSRGRAGSNPPGQA